MSVVVPPPSEDEDAGVRQPIIELRNVSRSYGPLTKALIDVELRFWRGESVAIIGRSGSGKSTLLNLLGLLDVPTVGEVLMDGSSVSDNSDRALAERRASDLGFVFQRAHLVGALTAQENVALGLRYAVAGGADYEGEAIAALDAVELSSKRNALARTLSGGEMQRVAIARTLVRPAALWLADEPTGNLDSKQSAQIIELLKKTAADRGACLVVVTHEEDVAARMDRVITLSDGRVVSDTRSTAVAVATSPNSPTRRDSWFSRARRTVQFVSQGVRANGRRSIIGVLSAALAVTLAITALGLAQSASSQVTSAFNAAQASEITAGLTLTTPDQARWPPRIDVLEKYAGVTSVEYWKLSDGVPMSNGNVLSGTGQVAEVAKPPGESTDSSIRYAKEHDATLSSGEVILGLALAKRLGITQLDLYPEVEIGGVRFRVVGFLTSSRVGTAAGSAFVIPGQVPGPSGLRSAGIYVKTTPGAAHTVAKNLVDIVDPYRTMQVQVSPVLAPDSFRGALEASVAASLQVLAAVAGLAGLIIVVFVNVLSVGSRTAEFGVRRAFGARRTELVGLVLGESSFLGFVGALLGLALGFVVIMVATAIARWQPVFDMRLLLIPLVGTLLFGTIGGLPPAVLAGRILPAEAVRSE